MLKHCPRTRNELKKLVDKDSINLADICTCCIDDMSYVFANSTRQDFSGLETWCISNVKDMQGMFYNATHFNYDINSWNVSNVTNMKEMFCGAVEFNQPLNKWKPLMVEDMEYMFGDASVFNQDISGWDITKVKNMRSMFRNAKRFNQCLDKWAVDKVFCVVDAEMFEGSPLQNNPPKWY